MAKAKSRTKPNAGRQDTQASSGPAFLVPALGLIALTLVVYAGVWSFGYVQFDDPQYVYQNKYIADGLTWPSIQWAFTSAYAMNWHPVTWLSHMVDIQLFGLEPGPAHFINLLLHIGSTLLLFWLLLTTTGARGASAFVAALFAVHPLHVESVAWVSERKDVLSTFFWMLTLVAYAQYVKTGDRRRYWLLLGCFAIGLMAKPMLVTLPFVLLLLDWWPLKKPGPRFYLLPLFALAAAASVATVIAQRLGGAVVNLEVIPLGLRVQNAVVTYVEYLIKMIWPSGLHMYYPYPQAIPMAQVAIALIVIIAITTAAIAVRKRWPFITVGWLWYLGTLVPVIGFVQVGRQAMADRYTYIPLVGVFVIIAFSARELLSRLPARRWLAPALAGVILIPTVAVARAQVQHWRNDQALWTHALQVATDLEPRRAALATQFLLAEGNVVPLQTLLFSQASGGDVFRALARQYIGRLFARHNQPDEAIAMFQDAIRLGPSVGEFHSDLASVYARQGKSDAAIVEFREAVRLAPESPVAHRNLGVALMQAGKNDEAVKELQEVLRLKPDAGDVRQALAELLRKIGK